MKNLILNAKENQLMISKFIASVFKFLTKRKVFRCERANIDAKMLI